MAAQIQLGDIQVEVVRKNIKNIHLSVYPPHGRVRISAPERISPATLRVFAIGKLGWIKRQQRKLRDQERETPREYIDRESHYVWGRRYLLKIIEVDEAPFVEIGHGRIVLRVRPGTDVDRRREIIEEWQRTLVREAASELFSKWEKRMGLKVRRIFVQRMKTKWGSCNHRRASIRLNTDLASKPRECLEYIIVHEMVHLFEPTHNERFMFLMDKFLPKWRVHREVLNRLPVRHEKWGY